MPLKRTSIDIQIPFLPPSPLDSMNLPGKETAPPTSPRKRKQDSTREAEKELSLFLSPTFPLSFPATSYRAFFPS
ncbi:hypothetical protein L249_1730 [Ophiocordyceps polyrhachis-furcata BCC 54312]|uniref:Uncharacterized protein n=1 Tax=Ophiocordyceps polyrhachis-furcata BCC 54312 TaxID=1330021 RepID=A0A367LPX8_9HYPO|nr:hypothetical protein L249_1730 [Ophiocordyceps polyrhachis-furcata BCC 54312]